MGHRFCQWNQGLCMVLVTCLVLCLGPGAETLKCKHCHGKTSKVCLKKAEDVDCRKGDRCAVQVLHYLPDNELRSVVMECWEKSSPCGVKQRKGLHQLTFKCCSDRDFCNKDLFSACAKIRPGRRNWPTVKTCPNSSNLKSNKLIAGLAMTDPLWLLGNSHNTCLL